MQTKKNKPHFIINNNFQKGGKYQDLLTQKILSDVCLKITGTKYYTVEFIDIINKGRQAKLLYDGVVNYISFSENRIQSRNSSFQSFPTALVNYYNESNIKKKIYFYILPTEGNIETNYFIFMYCLIKTIGVEILNSSKNLSTKINPFSSLEDIILHKKNIRDKNKSNNSTYITKTTNNIIEIFGKLYGANKYETTLLAFAVYNISSLNIKLYEIEEGKLTKLPKAARNYLLSLDRFDIITADITLEKSEFNNNNSLRSPRYIYNLLEKLGDKKCAFCECDIPQIIQGAHIWPVADIKKEKSLAQEKKLACAINGDNGLWLCQNHHKLLDVNILKLSKDGSIKYKKTINKTSVEFIKNISVNNKLSDEIMTDEFIDFLYKRNKNIKEDEYINIA